FKTTHPQYTSHCMKQLDDSDTERVPVLIGYPIPKADNEEQELRYFAAMLMLFKPWSGAIGSPLKDEQQSWAEAFQDLKGLLPHRHQKILQNMQLVYQSREAKDDYSAQRRQ
ncbi:hypothetical protein FB45DRAFT_693292, partial [Roridomyces roridus]